jgi:MFS superfamily sulfate permease-like transporter
MSPEGNDMQDYLNQALNVVRDGYGEINGTMGLVIALAATLFLRSWSQWIPAATLATLVHIAIEHFAPVLAGKEPLALPDLMTQGFWVNAGVLLVGYLVVIGIFFFAKRILMVAFAGGGGKKKH